MQQIFHGIEHLSEALTGSKKVMLVCDNSFVHFNIKEQVESIQVPHIQFSQFSSNPLYEDVCKGVDLFNAEGCDTILAVGGGSSLDVGKCIKLYCKMQKDKLYLDQEYKDTGIKLIAVPTTAGTGSESTRYAVIYYDGKKQSVTHDSIVPNIAILESKVLKTLPAYQKKCTMLDALCQGIESWWSINSTDKSKDIAKQAIKLIMQNWRAYIFENDDKAAEIIMQAANLAGQAICITQTTAAHAFSYKLTSLYSLPHGHAVAVGLPEIWKYMTEHPERAIDQRGQAYVVQIFYDIAKAMGAASPQEGITIFRKMMGEMGMNNPKAINRSEEIEKLATSVNPIRLKNNPVLLDTDAIVSLYQDIIK